MSQNADTPGPEEEKHNKRKGLIPILIGILGAIVLGGAGFYSIYSGMILGPSSPEETRSTANQAKPLPNYLPIDQLTLSLADHNGAQHLRISAQIEVAEGRLREAEAYQPRFLALINTYLRALAPSDLQDSAALIRLRAQILRRLQMVAGEDIVDDFLITEFILN